MAEERNHHLHAPATEPLPPDHPDNAQLKDSSMTEDYKSTEPQQSSAPLPPQDDGSSAAVDNVLHSEVSVISPAIADTSNP